ncbi:hypothetical protein GCM10009753_73680 [Streptantibioticus ferralitis]
MLSNELTEAAPRHAIGGDPGASHSGSSSEEPADQPKEDDLLGHARREDAWHWETYQRPISAETLRKRLLIGGGCPISGFGGHRACGGQCSPTPSVGSSLRTQLRKPSVSPLF